MNLLFDPLPVLENELVKLVPLEEQDFESLLLVASDPLIWEQHPNKERWKRGVFQTFFKGALESKQAFIVYDQKTGAPMGSSRFYDFDADQSVVSIGYTFLARSHWGGLFNRQVKSLMLERAFQSVERVIFEIGAVNLRSQKAIEKLGAVKIDEKNVQYYGEQSRLNFVYEIRKDTSTAASVKT